MLGVGLGLALIILVLVVTNLQKGNQALGAAKLLVWGTESPRNFDVLKTAYKKFRPNIELSYAQVAEETYDEKLLEALALGEGPDVFLVKNHSLLKDKAKLAPLNLADFGLIKLRALFPQAVEQDFVSAGKIYALPLYLDTLALYFNKDLFDQAGIVYPPTTWEEFQEIIPSLRRVDEVQNIIEAGAAIGGSGKSIAYSSDILNALMLQNGALMVSKDLSRATFSENDRQSPGFQAFSFYLQFSNPLSPYYSWNDYFGDALTSFGQGKVAMVFGYYSDLKNLRDKNPFLNIGVARLPQVNLEKAVDYSKYVGLGVSKRSRYQAQAWDLVVFASTDKEYHQNYYNNVSKRPPALKSLISQLVTHPEMEVFARQALTARSWSQVDGEKVDQIFSDAIESVIWGRSDAEQALGQAEEKVTQVLKSRK